MEQSDIGLMSELIPEWDFHMRKLLTVVFLLLLTGCSSVRIPDYIKADHPYVRKFSGDYDTIVSVVKDVLYKQGWLIQQEVNPSEYERREGGEDQARDVLLFSEIKKHSKVAYATYTHLNVFIHANADGAEVDIRYEAITPGPIKQSNLRNDRLANRILDQVEQAIEGK